MSIEIRNFEETDVEKTHAFVTPFFSTELANLVSPDAFKNAMLMDTCFSIVAEADGAIHGAASVLMAQETPETVIGMMTRLYVPENEARQEVAGSLVNTVLQSLEGNLQICFIEVPVTWTWAMVALEQNGFFPCGLLPLKFSGETRHSAMVYANLTALAKNQRRPHPAIISSVKDISTQVLSFFGITYDAEVRDDLAAYPTECDFNFSPIDATAVRTVVEEGKQIESEIFEFLHEFQSSFHLPADSTKYFCCKDGDKVIGIVGYIWDPLDKKVQITDLYAVEKEPQGFLVRSLIESLNQELSPDYYEVVVSAHAPRAQKTFDQLGFVPSGYIPCFAMKEGRRTDAIKMVRLEAGYVAENQEYTSMAETMFNIVDTVFREQNVGGAVINLLKDLKIFQGLGEGELRRVARLFSQKLFKPNETIFEEGSSGREMYVIERGEIEIRTNNRVLGTLKSGAVIGEMAFLNGEPRTASAVSKSATIARIISRTDFDNLLQKEAHLGLIFFKNVALDLAEKLKKSVIQTKKNQTPA